MHGRKSHKWTASPLYASLYDSSAHANQQIYDHTSHTHTAFHLKRKTKWKSNRKTYKSYNQVPVCLRWWSLILLLVEKLWSQYEHRYLRSPVCVLMCTRSSTARATLFPQTEQTKFLTPVWVGVWARNALLLVNDLWQMLQVNGRSPECVLRWIVSSPDLAMRLPHIVHW